MLGKITSFVVGALTILIISFFIMTLWNLIMPLFLFPKITLVDSTISVFITNFLIKKASKKAK